jgi:hypothetical protein
MQTANRVVDQFVWIYGFYDMSGRAVYIGQAADPKRRKRQHVGNAKSRNRDVLFGCCFRVLRKTTHQDAGRIEAQIIAAYKRRGEACRNEKRYAQQSQSGMGEYRLRWLEKGVIFTSLGVAARVIGVGSTALSGRVLDSDGEPFSIMDGVTLQGDAEWIKNRKAELRTYRAAKNLPPKY